MTNPAQIHTPASTFTKRYRDSGRCQAALIHHAWLADLGAPVPDIITTGANHIEFVNIPGRHAGPDDLVTIAGMLGHLHGHAHAQALNSARLDQPFPITANACIADFTTTRLRATKKRFHSGAIPDPGLTLAQVEELLDSATGEPVAFYKDSNPRNFLITPDEPVLLDFDDLTLAPFGYDLAKLLVTTTMTHGTLSIVTIERVLGAYNKGAAEYDSVAIRCTLERLLQYAELHHVLTSSYLGTNGYRHSWHFLRPHS